MSNLHEICLDYNITNSCLLHGTGGFIILQMYKGTTYMYNLHGCKLDLI